MSFLIYSKDQSLRFHPFMSNTEVNFRGGKKGKWNERTLFKTWNSKAAYFIIYYQLMCLFIVKINKPSQSLLASKRYERWMKQTYSLFKYEILRQHILWVLINYYICLLLKLTNLDSPCWHPNGNPYYTCRCMSHHC